MKRLDLMLIGNLALFALIFETGVAVHAPSASADQLALYASVPMHSYLNVPGARVHLVAAGHGLKSAGRQAATSHAKSHRRGKGHPGGANRAGLRTKKH